MPISLSDSERTHLERAVELAGRGWGQVHPNPLVGCVIAHGEEIVGEGWHKQYGGPHAEVVALADAGVRARGATAFVTLEPCRHEGKTPPCSQALRRAGVARVVYGAADPGGDSGGGGAELAESGIEVVGPVFDRTRARALNPAFHHRFTHDRPWVALKLAISLDGGLAAAGGEQTRLTGPESEAEVHRMRAGADGIVVGGVTGRVDDPRLTVRGAEPPRVPPVRIVLDPEARTASDAALFESVDDAPVWLFVRDDAPESEVSRLEGRGATVLPVAAVGPHELDLAAVIRRCGERGRTALLCEGGGRLGAALARADLVDRLVLFVAPRFLGADAVAAFPGWPPSAAGSGRWRPVAPPRRLGVDTLLAFDRLREDD